ncbi:MAG: hypothetical protein EBR81_04915 [Proteobacteria bacterium]|nr:hypothetical protein [Pseudomonadota bacterium]
MGGRVIAARKKSAGGYGGNPAGLIADEKNRPPVNSFTRAMKSPAAGTAPTTGRPAEAGND